MDEAEAKTRESTEIVCAQCGRTLAEDQERVKAEDAVFCPPCYEALAGEVARAVEAQQRDIPYGRALLGAVLGGAVGVLAWWGFTVATNVGFGLVAVVIGVAAAKGALLLAGQKRSKGMQFLCVAVSVASYFYASYLVNRTFITRETADQGRSVTLPLLPNPNLFLEIVSLGFGAMDLVFLAIVVYEAWRIPAPLRIRSPG